MVSSLGTFNLHPARSVSAERRRLREGWSIWHGMPFPRLPEMGSDGSPFEESASRGQQGLHSRANLSKLVWVLILITLQPQPVQTESKCSCAEPLSLAMNTVQLRTSRGGLLVLGF